MKELNLEKIKERSTKDREDKDLELKEALEMKPYLIGDMRILEENRRNGKVEKERIVRVFLDFCKYIELCGGKAVDDVSIMYSKYISKNEELVVRRESPESLVKIMSGENKEIFFDTKVFSGDGSKYANCAIWPHGSDSVAGIKNAFLEGKSFAGPIVSLMALNLESSGLSIEEPEGKMMKVGDISRESVKILDGTIRRDDLEFVVLRLPSKFFPEEMLTDRERLMINSKKDDVFQIFRGFVFK